MVVEIKSKEEAIKWAKWLRKKLDNWEEEGYEGTKIKEKKEFITILKSVENFLEI